MAWLLIITGFILIVSGIYGRYRQYTGDFEKEKEVIDCREVLFSGQQDKLLQISRELDRLIAGINEKERELATAVNGLKVDKLKPEDRSSINDFKQILDRSINQKNEEDNPIPEKYSKVFALVDKNLKAEEIARRLDLGVRETELIIRLYREGVDSLVK